MHLVLCPPTVVVMGAPNPASKAVREGVLEEVPSKLMIQLYQCLLLFLKKKIIPGPL